jgi:myo-inositol-1(or 4)-monophosphatase
MEDRRRLAATCEHAARAGGAELMAWRGRFAAREKAARDLVTDADLASQAAATRLIRQQHPGHAILAEESPQTDRAGSDYCWIVDPLDGTTNYVHGFPFYCVSVAVSWGAEVVAGAVYDPVRDECFTAARGEGAFLDGAPLRTSDVEQLEQALAAVSFPAHLASDSADLASFLRAAPRCQAIRRTGSAALNLAYVAAGRLDAHWAHEIFPWDAAAGTLLVQEAGGVATGVGGEAFRWDAAHYLAASTEALHRALLPLVGAAEAPSDAPRGGSAGQRV